MGLTTPARLLCYLQDPDFPDFRRVQRNLMGTLVRIQPKGQMTIPRRVRSAVGLIDGDLLEVRAVGKRIVIVPQLVIDRSKFPNADDETEQRRIIKCPPGRSRKGTFSRPIQRRRRGCGFPREENPEHRQGGQIKKIGMNVHLSQTAVEGLFDAPLPVQKAFIKQINYLVRNLTGACGCGMRSGWRREAG